MRYIDANALMKELEREVELADDWKTAHEIANVAKYFPTTEIEPRHAHWITRNRKERLYQCSHCGAGDSFPNDLEVNYCWNCGAKMDEKEGDWIWQE